MSGMKMKKIIIALLAAAVLLLAVLCAKKVYRYSVKWLKNKNTEKVTVDTGVIFDSVVFDSEDMDVRVLSGGNLHKIPASGDSILHPFSSEKKEFLKNSVIENATDYIKCPEYILINIKNKNAGFYLFFFDRVDGRYVPRWDILFSETKDRGRNFFDSSCGSRVIAVPDGVYLKACDVSKKNSVEIYGWNGIHTGCEMAGTAYTLEKKAGSWVEVTLDSRQTGLMVPGEASLIWCRDALFSEVIGVDDAGNYKMINQGVSQVISLPSGYSYFRIKMVLASQVSLADLSESIIEDATVSGDLNEKISCLCAYSGQKPYGRAKTVIDTAKSISETEWICRKDTLSLSEGGTFRAGVRYEGIPYSSLWTEPHFYGWHITKHTFINAANDPESVFYSKTDKNGNGFGYGLVCTSFAELCDGWTYPLSTYCLTRDPNVSVTRSSIPIPGSIMYNGTGHIVIPETSGQGKTFQEYTLYESVSPITLRRSAFSFLDNVVKNTRSFSYIDPYVYVCEHSQSKGIPTVYDITGGEIINGSARPNKGDRSVYTSDDLIQINIYDEKATACFYQKYYVSGETFVATSEIEKVSFLSGRKKVYLDKEKLEDGAFYAVYTDSDQTKEFFEYHVVHEETYQQSKTNFVFSRNDFWYVLWDESKTVNGETFIIPRIKNKKYSQYFEVYDPKGTEGVMFFKGCFGAYCTKMVYTKQEEKTE